jgi:hypothetical protein
MAIYTTYDMQGLAEDVEDEIYDVSPIDNPICSMSQTLAATARKHEWQEDDLAAIKKNAKIEGAAAGADTSTATTIKDANCQIFAEVAEISRTSERVRKYGRASEMNYQVYKRKLEMIRDEESAVSGGAGGTGRQAGSAGAGATPGPAAARELTSIYSQVAAGNIVDAIAAADVAALEVLLLSMLQATYSAGGNPGYLVTDEVSGGYFPKFTLAAGRTRDVEGSTLYNAIDLYVSQWGTYDVVMSRSMAQVATENAIIAFDPEFAATPVLDPTHDYALAKVGDSDRRQVIRESTFAVLNSNAHGILDNVQVGLA